MNVKVTIKKAQLVYKIPYTIFCWSVGIFLWLIAYLFLITSSIGSDRKEFIYNTASRFVARLIVQTVGVKVNVIGAENIPKNEAVIFVSNHQSFFDIKLVFAFVPQNFSFISKESVFFVPLVGKYMQTAGHVSLKREAGRKSYDTMNEVVSKLEKGKSLVVFPEGTRSLDGKLGKFKRGISLLVLQSGKKVVPMAIVGSGKFLPKGSMFFDPLNREITFKFGKPLTFEKREKVNRSDINKIVEDLRTSVDGLLT